MIMEHPVKMGQIVCPYNGSHEVGKGLEKKIKKDAGLK
jgi:mRNA interferase HicA